MDFEIKMLLKCNIYIINGKKKAIQCEIRQKLRKEKGRITVI